MNQQSPEFLNDKNDGNPRTTLATGDREEFDDDDNETFVEDIKQNYFLNDELIELATEVQQKFNNIYDDIASERVIDKNKQAILSDEQVENQALTSALGYESFMAKSDSDNENLSDDEYEITFDNDCLLPEFDWASLEAKLKETQDAFNNQNRHVNEREEIRKKLAIHENDDFTSDYLKKSSSKKSHLLGQNLQLCFMNETIDEHLVDQSEKSSDESRLNKQLETTNEIFKDLFTRSSSAPGQTKKPLNVSLADNQFLTKLLDLQKNTKVALSKAHQDARHQIEIEKKSKKSSPIADIVGVPTYGLKKLDIPMVSHMNVGQLQVILNDICSQTEKTNEMLKKLLVERDDLYIKQDSILVDIEDLTDRIQEIAQKFECTKKNHEESKPNTNNTETPGRLKMFGMFKNKFYALNKKPP
jgi:hypothetical protein